MTDSLRPDRGGLPGFQVCCGGQSLPDDAQLVSMHVRRAFGSVASARLVLVDGEMSTGEWPLANADTFKPGVQVSIAAGYDGITAPIFEGVVTRLGTRIAGDSGSQLVVECRDKAVQMTLGRKSAKYVKLSDGQLITQLAQASGLATDVETTPVEYPAIVQQDCSDWDIAMASAARAGLLVLTQDGQLRARAPQTSAAPVLKLAWGRDLLEWCADLDAHNPLSAARAAAWTALARIHGRMQFQGSALALPGKLVTVSGVGKRFSGDVFLTAIEHELADGDWTTRAEFGLAEECFSSRPDGAVLPGQGLLPGVFRSGPTA
jgi:phage protein D